MPAIIGRLGLPLKSHLRLLWQYVPKCPREVSQEEAARLQDFLQNSKRLMVLTGAGISTESGIPDYRSEGVGLYACSTYRPTTIQEFLKSSSVRKRYWARNFVGWPRFSSIEPNSSHRKLADWEEEGKVGCLVTQNVDRLHQKAGSQRVVELHGTSYEVVCLSCQDRQPRSEFQMVLAEQNPNVVAGVLALRPDGDVDLKPEDVQSFAVPPCKKCGGMLKPDVVFFGDNVPKSRVMAVLRELDDSDALLAIGSSLSVFSAFRIILHANQTGKEIAILNIGTTRGDKYATLKVDGRCGEVLEMLSQGIV